MPKRGGKSTAIVLVAIAAAFGWGVFQLLVTRFEAGDMFPPYSSYRNDPVGTKALFASLNRVPEIDAVRYVDPLVSRAEASAKQTFLMIGVNTQQPHEAPRSIVEELDQVMKNGGRVVLAFSPNGDDFRMEELQQMGIPGVGPPGDEEADEEEEKVSVLAEPTVRIDEHWGIDLRHESLSFDGDGNLIPAEAVAHTDEGLPAELEWHTGLYFEINEGLWQPVYKVRDRVVAAERSVGEGSLVFLADPYYMTNEGLAADRQPELLAWIIGGNAFVQFDEEHLGMQQHPGAARLMRRYHLESLVAGFIGLALLFAWRAASSLAPRYEDTLPSRAGDLELGRDAHAGFANLVQRSTPPSDVVGVCVNQWRNSVLPNMGRTDAKEIADELTAIVQANKATAPVETYRAVLNQLRERNVITAHDRKS